MHIVYQFVVKLSFLYQEGQTLHGRPFKLPKTYQEAFVTWRDPEKLKVKKRLLTGRTIESLFLHCCFCYILSMSIKQCPKCFVH